MASTPNLGLPYPAPSDAPDGTGAFYALATALDNQSAVWAAFNVSPQNVNIGASGYAAGRWARIAHKTIHAEYEIFLNGSGAGVGGMIVLNLPVTAVGGLGTTEYWPSGRFDITGSDGVNQFAAPVIASANSDPRFFTGRLANGPVGAASAAWGSLARIHVSLTYVEA